MTEIVRWTIKREIKESALKVADFTLGLSVCAYTCEMRYGVFFAVVALLLRIVGVFLDDNRSFGSTLNGLWAWFLLTFALALYKVNAVHFEPAFAVAYWLSVALLVLPNYTRLSLALRCVYYFSFFIMLGIWLQYIFPDTFTAVAKYYLTPTYLKEVLSRRQSGYVTGFTREVSYSALILLISFGYCAFFQKEKGVLSYVNEKLFKDEKKRGIAERVERYALCVLYLVTLFITGKKSQPVLALVGMAVVWFMLLKNRKHRWIVAGTLLGCVVLALASFPLWKKLPGLSRIAEFVDGILAGEDLNKLTNGRMTIYYRAVELWKEDVCMGIGWVNFRRLGMVISRPETHWFNHFDVHNCYLQVLCETGIIGFTIFMGLIGYTCWAMVKKCIKNKTDDNMRFSAYFFVFFLLYAFVEPSLYTDSYLLVFFLVVSYIGKKPYTKTRVLPLGIRKRVGAV